MINSLNPLDGRYHNRTEKSRSNFNQRNITRIRCEVEFWYYCHLLTDERSPFYVEHYAYDSSFSDDLHAEIFPLNDEQYDRIKELEEETRHDVRAVIEFIIEEIVKHQPWRDNEVRRIVHFGLTSQDVVDAADVIAMKSFLNDFTPTIISLFDSMHEIDKDNGEVIMLSRTHGQPAVPTSWHNFIEFHRNRLRYFADEIYNYEPTIKFSGATGGLNAHKKFFKEPKKLLFSFTYNTFYKKFGVFGTYDYSTQVSPYVHRSKLFGNFVSISACLLDFCRDLWNLNARGLLVTKGSNSSSSTMPTKSNPIAAENAESNLKVAMMWFQKLQTDLLISRDQRDLSGSSLYRNVGVAFGHFELALKSLTKYLNSTSINRQSIENEIYSNMECMSELLYLQLKLHGVPDSRNVTNRMFELGITNDTTWSMEINGLSSEINENLMQMLLSLDYKPIQF